MTERDTGESGQNSFLEYSSSLSRQHADELVGLKREFGDLLAPPDSYTLLVTDPSFQVDGRALSSMGMVGISLNVLMHPDKRVAKHVIAHELTHLRVGEDFRSIIRDKHPEVDAFFRNRVISDWIENGGQIEADHNFMTFKEWDTLYGIRPRNLEYNYISAHEAVDKYFTLFEKGRINRFRGNIDLNEPRTWDGETWEDVKALPNINLEEFYKANPREFIKLLFTGYALAEYLQDAVRDSHSYETGMDLWTREEGFCTYIALAMVDISAEEVNRVAAQDSFKWDAAERLKETVKDPRKWYDFIVSSSHLSAFLNAIKEREEKKIEKHPSVIANQSPEAGKLLNVRFDEGSDVVVERVKQARELGWELFPDDLLSRNYEFWSEYLTDNLTPEQLRQAEELAELMQTFPLRHKTNSVYFHEAVDRGCILPASMKEGEGRSADYEIALGLGDYTFLSLINHGSMGAGDLDLFFPAGHLLTKPGTVVTLGDLAYIFRDSLGEKLDIYLDTAFRGVDFMKIFPLLLVSEYGSIDVPFDDSNLLPDTPFYRRNLAVQNILQRYRSLDEINQKYGSSLHNPLRGEIKVKGPLELDSAMRIFSHSPDMTDAEFEDYLETSTAHMGEHAEEFKKLMRKDWVHRPRILGRINQIFSHQLVDEQEHNQVMRKGTVREYFLLGKKWWGEK